MKARVLVSLLGLALLVQAGSARALQTENTGMQALPAPGPVAMDGKLNDWDLSGGIFTCDVRRGRGGIWRLHRVGAISRWWLGSPADAARGYRQ